MKRNYYFMDVRADIIFLWPVISVNLLLNISLILGSSRNVILNEKNIDEKCCLIFISHLTASRTRYKLGIKRESIYRTGVSCFKLLQFLLRLRSQNINVTTIQGRVYVRR